MNVYLDTGIGHKKNLANGGGLDFKLVLMQWIKNTVFILRDLFINICALLYNKGKSMPEKSIKLTSD